MDEFPFDLQWVRNVTKKSFRSNRELDDALITLCCSPAGVLWATITIKWFRAIMFPPQQFLHKQHWKVWRVWRNFKCIPTQKKQNFIPNMSDSLVIGHRLIGCCFSFFPTMSVTGLEHGPITMHIAAISSCHEWFCNRPVFRFSSVKHFLQSAWGRLCFWRRRSCHRRSGPCCVIPKLVWRISINVPVSYDGQVITDFSKESGWGMLSPLSFAALFSLQNKFIC